MNFKTNVFQAYFFRKTTMKKLLREIYVEHFHDIFPENSEKVPYGILWDVPK